MPPKTKAKAAPKKTAARASKDAAAEKEKLSAEKIVGLFRAWDTGRDGRITVEELTAILTQIGLKKEKVPEIFEAADLNSDGFVDYNEFVSWLFSKAPASVLKYTKEAKLPPKSEEEGKKRFDDLLLDVFKCFDEDQDGLLERVELLNVTEQLYKEMGDLFGIKDRKSCVQWFKAAGAEGSTTDGMYLTFDKWKVAYVTQLKEKAGCSADEPAILADYLYKNIAERLFKITYKLPAGTGEAPEPPAEGAPPRAPPAWPITVELTKLQDAMGTAAEFERSILILSSGLTEVETFLKYRTMGELDCKRIQALIQEPAARDEWRQKAREKLAECMSASGFCKPLHIRMNDSAFDWVGFCCDQVPADVFSPSLWTSAEALKQGFIDEGQKFNVDVENGKKWKDFQVVISSTHDLAKANELLADKIPHWDELAIIVIDPNSLE